MAIEVIPAARFRTLRAALVIGLAAVLVATGWRWGGSSPRAAAQDARSGDRQATSPSAGATGRDAVALARLLPASGLISVGARPGARVVELKVKEGDEVAAGAILALMEGNESARLQLELATARRKQAEHERAVRLGAARKAAELTDQRARTGRELLGQFGGTLKGKDRYDAELALYQLEMQAIRNHLDLDLAQGAPAAGGGPAPEDAMLKAQVDLASAAVRDTEVRAPSPGRVLRILAHAGELSSGPLLQLGDVSSMVARAEVYQSDVPRIRPGDPAEVDILGTRVPGKVTRIGAIVAKNQLASVDPRAMRDLRVVDVTIQLERADPAGRFVDMEVDAVIRPSAPAAAAGAGSAD